LEIRYIEMIKVVANYFSTLATTIGSFVIVAAMVALISSENVVTIQGNVVNVTLVFFGLGMFTSLSLLALSCFILSLLDEGEEVITDESD
jgi:hypothetical protein